jgi:hypothetical protein
MQFILKLEAKMDWTPLTRALNKVLHSCKILLYSQIIHKYQTRMSEVNIKNTLKG